MMKSIHITALVFTSPIGRGRIWREAANPGEGLRSIERPYPLTPTLSRWEREMTFVGWE
jgi:hypothetical protein